MKFFLASKVTAKDGFSKSHEGIRGSFKKEFRLTLSTPNETTETSISFYLPDGPGLCFLFQ
jgi:hypothetical protein